jgi:hypothetical protein
MLTSWYLKKSTISTLFIDSQAAYFKRNLIYIITHYNKSTYHDYLKRTSTNTDISTVGLRHFFGGLAPIFGVIWRGSKNTAKKWRCFKTIWVFTIIIKEKLTNLIDSILNSPILSLFIKKNRLITITCG